MTNTKVVKDLSPEKRALLAQLVKEEGGSHSRRRVVPGMSQVGVHSLSSLSGWSRDHNDLYYSGLFGWRSKEMCREGAIVGSSMSPVFIIAHPRSGSTLLQLILDTHPEIAGPGELGVGQLCHDLCRTVNLTIGRTSGASNELERGSAIIAKVRQILSDLMSSYVAGKGKQIWCDKLHMLYTDIVRVLFPQARYICLYRHCMDVVQSCARSIRSSKVGLVEVRAFVLKHLGDVVAAALDSWCEYVSKQLIFERENDANCFRVTYESLVSNPSETLGPLFAFLGVEWDPDLLDSVFAVPHDPGPGDPAARFSRRIHTNSIGKGSAIRYKSIAAEMLGEMNPLLEKLGYPIVGPDWGDAPAPCATTDGPAKRREDVREVVSTAREVIEDCIPRQLKERGAEINTTFGSVVKVSVIGDHGGVWTIDLSKVDAPIQSASSDAHCKIVVSSSDVLVDVVNEKLNLGEAMLQGRIAVVGSLELAEVFGQILVRGTR